jgi:cell division septum initiation protein DivIVA
MDPEELIRQTSESVRSALDAAQRRAEEIVREAEAEAQRIRGKAEAEARERLDQVRQALERLEAGLRGGSAPQEPSVEPKPQAAKPEPEQSASDPEPREPEPAPTEPQPEKESTEELIEKLKAGGHSANAEPKPAAAASSEAPRDDPGAARLVAMKLAFDGTSRDEARKQLAADYEVADLDSLLDEVYAKAGK